MRLYQLLVHDVDPRRRDHAGNHVSGFVKKISIVDVAVAREGDYQGRLPAAARAPAALSIISGCRRYVAHMHDRQVLDVDAQLHGRRTEQDWQLAGIEMLLAQLSPVGAYLAGV